METCLGEVVVFFGIGGEYQGEGCRYFHSVVGAWVKRGSGRFDCFEICSFGLEDEGV